MGVPEHRIPNLANLPVPVTSPQEHAQLALLSDSSRLDINDLSQRYSSDRAGLSIGLFSRFHAPASEIRYADSIQEPRVLNPTLNVPFPTTSSNLAILQESRGALSSVGNVGQSNSYPMISSDIYNLNPQSQLTSSFNIPPSSQLSGILGYQPLHSSPSQNIQNIHRPSGEVLSYRVLGATDYASQLSDIPMRHDRPLMSPARLALENAHMRDDDHEMKANQSPLHGDSSVSHSPPRSARNNGDAGNVWRPYWFWRENGHGTVNLEFLDDYSVEYIRSFIIVIKVVPKTYICAFYRFCY